MKKTMGLMMVSLMFALTACAQNDSNEGLPVAQPIEAETAQTQTESDLIVSEDETFVFEVGDVRIKMHEKSNPILEALGDEDTFFEAESCAFQGKDRMYGYGSYEVITYELEGEEYVLGVVLYDDTVKTKEGLRLFEDKEKVLSLYGTPQSGNDKLLVYEDEITSISFVLNDANQVVSIEYNAVIGD